MPVAKEFSVFVLLSAGDVMLRLRSAQQIVPLSPRAESRGEFDRWRLVTGYRNFIIDTFYLN